MGDIGSNSAERDSSRGMRFPGEDGGTSLAVMAERDLDVVLHLLADRAQYITGASGAAIALRREGHEDLICRASAGSNAPELGTLLSTEFGLSGESVRTRSVLRCDDAERDSRVNHEACRDLGIASVMVVPITGDESVLGVIELFSEKKKAFGERDYSALRRLGEMVVTAVRLARAAQQKPLDGFPDVEVEGQGENEGIRDYAEPAQPAASAMAAAAASAAHQPVQPARTAVPPAIPAAKKPLLWSAAGGASGATPTETDRSQLPAAFRNLKKCEACGFPVSEGRKLCLDCEEKNWRGQLRCPAQGQGSDASVPKQGTAAKRPAPQEPDAKVPANAVVEASQTKSPPQALAPARVQATTERTAAGLKDIAGELFESPATAPTVEGDRNKSIATKFLREGPARSSAGALALVPSRPKAAHGESAPSSETSPASMANDPSLAFLNSTLARESWLSSYKYIVAAIIVIAGVVAYIVLR